MARFRSTRDAKEYLIARILAQADQDAVPLSDTERSMLYFSETAWTLPNMAGISQDFDQNYDQNQYEKKIGKIIRRICDQPDNDRAAWDDAVRRLRSEDHYLLVLIDGAFGAPQTTSRWDVLKYLLVGGVIAVMFVPVSSFVLSHVSNRAVAGLLIDGPALGMVVLAALLVTRGSRRSN